MQYAELVFAVLVVLMVHELGHALAMRRHGVEIEEIGIGLPLGPRFSFALDDIVKISFRSRNVCLSFPGIAKWFSFRPILFGAYVQVSEAGAETMLELAPKDQRGIALAGIRANILFGVLVLFLGLILRHEFLALGVGLAILSTVLLPQKVRTLLTILAVLGLGFGVSRAIQGMDSSTLASALMPIGPVGMFMDKDILSMDFLSKLYSFSFGVGFMNLLPMPPFDGGHVVLEKVERVLGDNEQTEKIQSRAYIIGTIVLVVVFLAITAKDILHGLGFV